MVDFNILLQKDSTEFGNIFTPAIEDNFICIFIYLSLFFIGADRTLVWIGVMVLL